MNIKGVNQLKGINYYNKSTSNKNDIKEKEKEKDKDKAYDRIEISEASKILKEYKVDNDCYDNMKKVLEVKKAILDGTYSYDARDIAKAIMDEMKGK